MEKIECPKELIAEMREIYKLILERISYTGEMLESDVLFSKLYKSQFEPLLYKLYKGD
jgi:hypothetical protein